MVGNKEREPGDRAEKLIEAKQQWAEDRRQPAGAPRGPLAGPSRLPPGQHTVKDWPVLDLGQHPTIAPETWQLTVDGAVAAPLRWSWAEFMAQPQSQTTSDIHCVTSWSRFDNQWQGVMARHLLALVCPLPQASFVLFHAYDGYTTNVPLAAFADDDVILAHSWEGKPLSKAHGAPLRAVIPKLYFWKSPKWVTRIEVLNSDQPGFWEERGYHSYGDPWQEQRYHES